MPIRLPWLKPDQPSLFPPTDSARKEPNGLLAAGGDLTPERLLCAYANGIFPWFDPGTAILWWSPDPRLVLFPENTRVSKRMRRWLRNDCLWTIRTDQQFEAVMQGCAAPRNDGAGTWLGTDMQAAYLRLHELGFAHSVEVYESGALIAGTYGVNLGGVFFAESMFGLGSNASKVALFGLAHLAKQAGISMIDCQVRSPHLIDRGAEEISRVAFEQCLDQCLVQEVSWPFDFATAARDLLLAEYHVDGEPTKPA